MLDVTKANKMLNWVYESIEDKKQQKIKIESSIKEMNEQIEHGKLVLLSLLKNNYEKSEAKLAI